MQTAANNSELIEILTLLLCGAGSVAICFVGMVLHDLRDRVMRIENHLFDEGPKPAASPHHFRKAGTG